MKLPWQHLQFVPGPLAPTPTHPSPLSKNGQTVRLTEMYKGTERESALDSEVRGRRGSRGGFQIQMLLLRRA